MTREQPPVRTDPLAEAASRRHELTRAKADPGPARARPGRHSRDIRRRRAGGRDLTVVALHPARHQRPDPPTANQGRRGRLRRHPRGPAGHRRVAARQAHHRPRPQQAACRRERPAPPPARPRTRRPAVGTGPDQVTIQGVKQPGSGRERLVGDTVHDGTPQVTAPADAAAKDNLKDGRAMRIETVVNAPRDLGCNARLPNLDELQAKARAVNRRILETERAGQGTVLASPAFERIAHPSVTATGGGPRRYGSAILGSWPWPALPTCCRPPASPTRASAP